MGAALEELECPTGMNRRFDEADDMVIGLGVVGSLAKEVQQLSCTADGGSFTLTFRGQTTGAVPFDGVPADLEAALNMLRSIGRVIVTGDTTSSAICDGDGQDTSITFITELANVPPITTDVTALTNSGSAGSATVTTTTGGKGYILECGGKGTCDRPSGTCKCWPGWASSDGYGNHGSRGDCGFSSVQ